MRGFVALEVSEDARAYLSGVISNLKDILGPANYTYPQRLHLTLAFMGEVEEEEFMRLALLLRSRLRETSRIRESLHHVDCFEKGSSQLFFLKLRDEQKLLASLAAKVRLAAKDLGIRFDPKPFLPHITLAREVSVDLARQTAKSLRFDPFTFCFSSLAFMKSERINGALRYTALERISLG